jgi:hypothetical protein
MSPEERMTIDEERKYLHKMRIRYWQAKRRSERGRLLDEMEAVTELHRKTLIRLINGELARKPRRKQRGKTYGAEVESAVRVIAQSLDYPCAERMQPNLVWMATQLEKHKELKTTPEVKQKLAQVSVSTVRRMLGPVGIESNRLAHQKQQPGASGRLRQAVPMRRIAWDEPHPGHFEVDLVHHCGASAEGQYVHTLQMIDVATGWSECVPLLGHSYLVMEDGFAAILDRLPFPVLELHPDNGSEFFNHYLMKSWKAKLRGVKFSRSRPFQKNDNRFVEENNFSLVRAYVGYQRLDTIVHLQHLHLLYDQLWLYHNFFQPVMRLKDKIHTPGQARSQRRYDLAQPPLDRLCAKGILETNTQNRLLALRAATNPCQVRCSIEQLTSQIFNLPHAKPDTTENVHQSLGLWQPHIFSLDQEHLHHVG